MMLISAAQRSIHTCSHLAYADDLKCITHTADIYTDTQGNSLGTYSTPGIPFEPTLYLPWAGMNITYVCVLFIYYTGALEIWSPPAGSNHRVAGYQTAGLAHARTRIGGQKTRSETLARTARQVRTHWLHQHKYTLYMQTTSSAHATNRRKQECDKEQNLTWQDVAMSNSRYVPVATPPRAYASTNCPPPPQSCLRFWASPLNPTPFIFQHTHTYAVHQPQHSALYPQVWLYTVVI